MTNLITVGAVSPELLLGRQIALTERDSFLGAFLVLLPESPTVTGQYHCGKVLHSPSVLFHNTFSSSASGKAVGFGAPKAQADRSKEENVLLKTISIKQYSCFLFLKTGEGLTNPDREHLPLFSSSL